MKLSSRFFSRLKTAGYVLFFPLLFLCGLAMFVWILTPLAARRLRSWFRRRVMKKTYHWEDPDSPHGRAVTLARQLEEEGRFNPLTWVPGEPIPAAVAEYLPAPPSHSFPIWVQDAYRFWAYDRWQTYAEVLRQGTHPARLSGYHNPDSSISYAQVYFRLPEQDDLRVCLTSDGYGMILPTSYDDSWAEVFELGGHPLNHVFRVVLGYYEDTYGQRFALKPRYEDIYSFRMSEHTHRRLTMKLDSALYQGMGELSPELRRINNLLNGGTER